MNTAIRSVYQVPMQRGFSVADAAKYLGMHPQTLRKKSDLGEVRCFRSGRARMFLLEDLDKWLQSQPEWVNGSR